MLLNKRYTPKYNYMAWLFTASCLVITLTSDSAYGSPSTSGSNPTLTLKLGSNYNINIGNNTFNTSIRNGISDTSEVIGVYNNDTINGKYNTTLMWTPTTTGQYYYVNVDNESINGQIIII